MSFNKATVWEIRAEGSQTNGASFADLDPGTSVDYSQQDAAQLSLTDLVSDGGGTGISSVTGGFTAAMVGNGIYIAGGTGFTTGFYQITAYTDTNNVTIDRSAGGTKTGGTGNVGGAYDLGGANDTAFASYIGQGNTLYIKYGTYTFASAVSTWAWGTYTLGYIYFEGYKTTRGDEPSGADRPTINSGGYYIQWGQYNMWNNLRFVGAGGGDGWLFDDYASIHNCFFGDSGTTRTSALCSLDNYANLHGCEFEATDQGTLINFNATSGYYSFSGCYFHADPLVGTDMGIKEIGIFENCIFNGFDKAIDSDSSASLKVNNCVFYNCTTALDLSSTRSLGISNNIFLSCTTAINGIMYGKYSDYNCFYDNTTDIQYSGSGKYGANDIQTDPLCTDPSNGDFTLQSGSPCLATGIGLLQAGALGG